MPVTILTTRNRACCLRVRPERGKHTSAVAVLRLLLTRGHEGIFFDYQNLLDRIRAGYNETLGTSRPRSLCFGARDGNSAARRFRRTSCDGLGGRYRTSIVTHRYNQRKPLIATTNLLDPEIGVSGGDKPAGAAPAYKTTLEERIGERARSRLFEMCRVIRMPLVEDYRLRRGKDASGWR